MLVDATAADDDDAVLVFPHVRMQNYSLSNKNIFKQIGMLPLNTYLELRMNRWLEKQTVFVEIESHANYLAPCYHTHVEILLPVNAKNIRHSYVHTLKLLGYVSCEFKIWMNDARDRKTWAQKVKKILNFPKDTYCRYNGKKQLSSFT